MDKTSKTYGRPLVVAQYSTEQNGEDVNTKGICPAALGTKDQQPASLLAEDRAVLRADEPRLHGLRAVQGELHAGPALCRRDPVDVPRRQRPWRHGQLHRLGRRARARSSGRNPEQFSVWSGALATAGDVVFYGTLEGYLKAVDAKTGKELYKFKTPSGHHRQRHDLHAQGQAVRRRALGRRRLGRHRPGGRAHRIRPRASAPWAATRALNNYTALGGQLTVFTLPQ